MKDKYPCFAMQNTSVYRYHHNDGSATLLDPLSDFDASLYDFRFALQRRRSAVDHESTLLVTRTKSVAIAIPGASPSESGARPEIGTSKKSVVRDRISSKRRDVYNEATWRLYYRIQEHRQRQREQQEKPVLLSEIASAEKDIKPPVVLANDALEHEKVNDECDDQGIKVGSTQLFDGEVFELDL